jgi:hypothetical protein
LSKSKPSASSGSSRPSPTNLWLLTFKTEDDASRIPCAGYLSTFQQCTGCPSALSQTFYLGVKLSSTTKHLGPSKYTPQRILDPVGVYRSSQCTSHLFDPRTTHLIDPLMLEM